MNTPAELKARIISGGLVPVIRAQSSEQAVNAAAALVESGIDILEITFTTPGALRGIEAVAERFGDRVVVGAGTVLDAETCRSAILAGARFVVAPSLDLRTIEVARRYSVVAIPGALTPTEVVLAWQSGADFVKVFPADAVGGPAYIKALKAPLPQIELIPTGGVTLATGEAYLKAGSAALGVGSDLVGRDDCRQGNWQAIREKALKFVQVVKQARQKQ